MAEIKYNRRRCDSGRRTLSSAKTKVVPVLPQKFISLKGSTVMVTSGPTHKGGRSSASMIFASGNFFSPSRPSPTNLSDRPTVDCKNAINSLLARSRISYPSRPRSQSANPFATKCMRNNYSTVYFWGEKKKLYYTCALQFPYKRS